MSGKGALARPLPALQDPEGDRVPEGLPPVIDAHVHVFPDRLFAAVRSWFDAHGWPIRYRLTAADAVRFLLDRGVEHLVLLQYAHRPGIARDLNRFLAGLVRGEPRVTGLATVFPGEPGAREILEEAVDLGLRGVKLHAHVQGIPADDAATFEVAAFCAERGVPLVAHFGREPRSPAYPTDPHRTCSAGRTRRLLEAFPGLKLVVPHLGADEFEAHAELLEAFDRLWLDTTMMLAGYFPGLTPPPITRFRADRILFGSDFPNLPYAWDRELRRIRTLGLPPETRERVLHRNAREVFGIPG
ncbi:amidohydrolase family protein [Deferrisoma palaeochoriense]